MVTPLTIIGALPPELGHRFNKSGTVKPAGIKVTAVRDPAEMYDEREEQLR